MLKSMTSWEKRILKNMPDRERGQANGQKGQVRLAAFFWGATQSDRVGSTSGRDDSLVASNGQWGIFSFAEPANYRTRTLYLGARVHFGAAVHLVYNKSLLLLLIKIAFAPSSIFLLATRLSKQVFLLLQSTYYLGFAMSWIVSYPLM